MNTAPEHPGSAADRLPLLWLLFAAACAAWAFSLYGAMPVNRDAGTYLPRALQILDGVRPLVAGYASPTPFSFYILAGWAALFGHSFAQAMLCEYLFHALNAGLVFCIARRIMAGAAASVPLAAVLALSTFCAVFLLDGKTLVLEPFVVFFLLLAYLAYLALGTAGKGWAKYVATGFLLGCAVMTKQHAAFVCVGFAGMVMVDRAMAGKGAVSPSTLARVGVMAAVALLPFLGWVRLEGLEVWDALRIFGVIGGKASQYVGERNFLRGLMVVVRKMFQTSWLFVPLVLYTVRYCSRPGMRAVRGAVWPVVLGCMTPVLVRQFGHYYQYLLPWGAIAWASLARDAHGLDLRKEPVRDGLWVVVCAGVGAVAGATVLRFGAVRLDEAAVNNLFLAILCVPLALLAVRRGLDVLRDRMGLMIACTLVAVPLVQAGSLDGEWYAARQRAQQELGAQVNRVFPPGSTALVVGLPELNVNAGLVNPQEYYEWSFLPQDVTDWREIPNVVVTARATRGEFMEQLVGLGFVELVAYRTDTLAFFRNPARAAR